MTTAKQTALRKELAALGERRDQINQEEEKLSDEVTRLISKAYGHISVAECARLLNMHRTTVYRVYLELGDG